MDKRNRTQLVLGVILILVAGWLIATRIKPDLANLLHFPFAWPMWVVAAGAGLLLLGLLVGAPDMAIPACITAGIKSATRIPMIAMTTSNSTSVKPRGPVDDTALFPRTP